MSGRRLGLDLDNTLADHRATFVALAGEAGIAIAPACADREALRAAVRGSTGGEALWQRLQAAAYGPRMGDARPFPGLAGFLAAARAAGYRLFVVSHRTTIAAADRGMPPVDLHATARAWLAQQGLTGPGAPIDAADVHLETSRDAKLLRIAQLAPQIFIDDLPEVLAHPRFPATAAGWRFAPQADSDWPALTRRLQGLADAARR